NDAVRELMKEFNATYLTHVNPYTGLAYTHEPAVMGLLLTNENDLTSHYGDKVLPGAGNPVHQAIFESRAAAFAIATGLPEAEVLDTSVPGPGKIFLNEQEHLFNVDLFQHLNGIGVRVPVATTNMWGNSRLVSLPALAEGSIIDTHAYGSDEALSDNPRDDANFISWMGASQVYGKPTSITEWNVPYPNIDRFIAPLYVASIASLQGWDAPMLFNYSSRATFDLTGPVHAWSTFVDPALTGMMPAAAIAYRQGHISPANISYCLDLDRSEAYFQELMPRNSRAIRTLMEQSQFSVCLPDIPELDWDVASNPALDVIRVTDNAHDYIPSGQSYVESDTGELLRDWQVGFQTIDTEKTQAASGWIGGRQIDLQNVSFEISTPKASVALSSLDGLPLDSSRDILISALAQAGTPDGDLPLLAEPVVGTLTLTADPGLTLLPINADGSEGTAIDPTYDGEAYTLALDGATHWYTLVPEPSSRVLQISSLLALFVCVGVRRRWQECSQGRHEVMVSCVC
ncbi:MAG: glycosyl hydrolase family 5, partial [Deltaproteobacteria bacterium]|nr:glycosyl hydrolase family 5 [Deltaproteobacteria bacterium]